jgi:hypothetical protein
VPDESILARSASLRLPYIDENNRSQRVDIIGDHLLKCATIQGELAQLRMEAHVELLTLLTQWNSASAFRAAKGVRANEELKRQEHPELAAKIDRAKWIIARTNEELDRLGGSDFDNASRAYTIIAGT